MDYQVNIDEIHVEIIEYFQNNLYSNFDFINIIRQAPLELAYCLALIQADDEYSIAPRWTIINYPKVDQIMNLLRGIPCIKGCSYCNDKLDAKGT